MPFGAVRQMRTSFCVAWIWWFYAAQSWCHSARAALCL